MNREQIEQGAWDVFCPAPTLREGVQRVVAYMQGLQGGALTDWLTLSVTAIAAENSSVAEYVAQSEKRHADLTANADFLRRSVGACHMMISRDDLLELTREEWESTSLPPRLFKYILAQRARPAEAPVADLPAKDLPRLVACAVIIRDGKVLLERRAPSGVAGLDGMWDLPGGKVECGETVADCIVREIAEELSICIRPSRLIPYLPTSDWVYADGERRHWILAAYECDLIGGEPVLTERLQWFDLHALPKEMLQADRRLLSLVRPAGASSDGPGDARCNQIKGLEQCVFKPGHAHDHKTVSGETWRNFYRPFVYEEAQPVQGGESRTVVPKEALAAAVELMRKWKGYPHPDSIENTALIRSTTGILEAALSVARPAILAEALAEIKIGEWGEIGRTDPPRSNGLERANRLLADRLRRLTQPPEPAARVLTYFNGVTDKFEVWLDGKMKWDHADNMAVRAMASGLIEELEAARQKAGAE